MLFEEPLRELLMEYSSPREGEIKIGEKIILPEGQALSLLKNKVKYAVLGIPESIGPLANYGKAGAENAWKAFLTAFCKMQVNRFFPVEQVALLGNIPVLDIQKKFQQTENIHNYRALVAEMDSLVYQCLLPVFEAGLIPIIIGGGHNNSYPILKAAAKAFDYPLQVINLDAHADFRPLEGRHSGNGFSYAFHDGYLHSYFVRGLQKEYNSEAMLQNMDQSKNIGYSFFRNKNEEQESSFFSIEKPLGLELDVDVIAGFPASARAAVGYSLEEAGAFVRNYATKYKIAYFHLPEAAPSSPQEVLYTGKALAWLVNIFIESSKH